MVCLAGCSEVTQGPEGPAGAAGPAGPVGPAGPPGNDGVGVAIMSIEVGDPNCPYGGTAFTSVSATTYACHGVPGPAPGAAGHYVRSDGMSWASSTIAPEDLPIIPDGRITGTYHSAVVFENSENSFSGGGAGLTSLNADALASGVVPASRMLGPYPGITAVGSLESLAVEGPATINAPLTLTKPATTGLINDVKLVRMRADSAGSKLAEVPGLARLARSGNWEFRLTKLGPDAIYFVYYRNGVRFSGVLAGQIPCPTTTPPTCEGSLDAFDCCTFDTGADSDPRDVRVLFGGLPSALLESVVTEVVLLNRAGLWQGHVISGADVSGN